MELQPMWEYWRDKKGIMEAIEQQYPELLKNDLEIYVAHQCAKTFLEKLDYIMKLRGL